MEHRRLKILFALIALFAFGVIVWYFLFSKPQEAPTLDKPTNPFSVRDLPARFLFIFQDEKPEGTTETEITLPGKQALVRIWDKPASGNIFVSRQVLREVTSTSTVGTTTVSSTKTVRATSTTLMFVDRTTGYVYGHDLDSGVTYQISNTTVPGVYDAYIFDQGRKVIMRYLSEDRKTIASILGSVPNTTPGNDPEPLIETTYLPKNISSVAISSDKTEVSYVVPSSSGATFYTLSPKGTTMIGQSPLSEWTVSYGGRQLYATPKASAYLTGSTLSLPSFMPVVSNKTGLVSIPSPSGAILSSMFSQSGLLTFGTMRGTSNITTSRTIASKCAPLYEAYFLCGVPLAIPETLHGQPDDWYQGRVEFNDQLAIINAANGDTTHLYSFDDELGNMDVIRIATHNTGELVSFIRKQDSSLYLLNTNLIGETESDNE